MSINQGIDLFLVLVLVLFMLFTHWYLRTYKESINQILSNSLNRDFLLREARLTIYSQYVLLLIAVGFVMWRFYELLQGLGAMGAGFIGLISLCASYCIYQLFYFVPLRVLVKSKQALGH